VLDRIDYTGKRALVMGLGLHGGGAGVARYLAQRGAEVTVTDLQSAEKLGASLESLRNLNVRFVLGEHRETDFATADFVVRNPAVPAKNRFLAHAQAHGVPIYMEMTLFFMECPPERVAGITGTKGKTTTTTLLGEILKRDGREVVVAGNLRVSALEQLARITPQTDVVLELSSFQLEGLATIEVSPRAAILTNLMPDHLNRYASLEAYFDAKRTIFRYQGADGVVALNRDDPNVREMAKLAPGYVVWYSLDDEVPGIERTPLRGAHNRSNMAAAAALASALGVSESVIGDAIASFGGVPYRQEVVRELDGVRYVNDSAATTPEAACAALASVDRPVVLIAGGADKELEFGAFAAAVLALDSPVRHVVLLEGSATDKVAAALQAEAVTDGAGSPEDKVAGRYKSFREAIEQARALARPGDCVLLSPGCASFGMFVHEFDRGDQFNAIVRSF
jgi:UDP-N-acetylmuramoylalanine--D-glutamate ligase